MARLPGISTELAHAVRAVNAAYLRIPESYRPEVATWTPLECEVDAACAASDRERALRAIEAWRDHHLEQFSHVLLNAPLENRSGSFEEAA